MIISETAMNAAKNICHDLHEGHIAGTRDKNLFPVVNLHCQYMQAAREHIAILIQQQLDLLKIYNDVKAHEEEMAKQR